jgi:hypothetical protein
MEMEMEMGRAVDKALLSLKGVKPFSRLDFNEGIELKYHVMYC